MKITLSKLRGNSSKRRRLNPVYRSLSAVAASSKNPNSVNMKCLWRDGPDSTFNPRIDSTLNPHFDSTSNPRFVSTLNPLSFSLIKPSDSMSSRTLGQAKSRSAVELCRVDTFSVARDVCQTNVDNLPRRNGTSQNIVSAKKISKKRSPSAMKNSPLSSPRQQKIKKTSLNTLRVPLAPRALNPPTTPAMITLGCKLSCSEIDCMVCSLTKPDLRRSHHRVAIGGPDYFRNFV